MSWYLPPIMIGLVDEEQNFVFLHENALALLGDVLEVEADADKGLFVSHLAHLATADTLEHGASIPTLKNAVAKTQTEIC